MGIGVNARTAFSLLFPPILEEFRWDRGVTAGAFSFGFVVSAMLSPVLGAHDGPGGPARGDGARRRPDGDGAAAGAADGEPWHLYPDPRRPGRRRQRMPRLLRPVTVPAQLVRTPPWDGDRHRLCRSRGGLHHHVALGAAGDRGAPGWRAACVAMGTLLLVVLAPINLLLRKRPEDLGLRPDGDAAPSSSAAPQPSNVVNRGLGGGGLDAGTGHVHGAASGGSRWRISPASTPGTRCRCTRPSTWWRSGSARRSRRGRWASSVCSASPAADRARPLSDRIGREWIWTIASAGFAICFLALIALEHSPTLVLLYVMVAAQGGLGYGLTSIFGAVVAEIYQGKHYGSIFGTLMLAAIAGGALGPWATGVLYDAQGSYATAFWICVGAERAVDGGGLAGGPAQGARRSRPDASPAAAGAGRNRQNASDARSADGLRRRRGHAVAGQVYCPGMRLPSAAGRRIESRSATRQIMTEPGNPRAIDPQPSALFAKLSLVAQWGFLVASSVVFAALVRADRPCRPHCCSGR